MSVQYVRYPYVPGVPRDRWPTSCSCGWKPKSVPTSREGANALSKGHLVEVGVRKPDPESKPSPDWVGFVGRAILIIAAIVAAAWLIEGGLFEGCDGEYVAQIDRTTECVEAP